MSDEEYYDEDEPEGYYDEPEPDPEEEYADEEEPVEEEEENVEDVEPEGEDVDEAEDEVGYEEEEEEEAQDEDEHEPEDHAPPVQNTSFQPSLDDSASRPSLNSAPGTVQNPPAVLHTIDPSQDQQQHSSSNLSSSIFGGVAGGLVTAGVGALTSGQPFNFSTLLSGVMQPAVGNLISEAAHSFFGIDPSTGRIIGAIAGNLIFNMGGRDNSLGSIGKIILDNIISGKFKRKVDPFVGKRQVGPPLDFHVERDRCLRERRLFEDPQFPPDDRSLFFSKAPEKRIVWKRPGEIVNDPQLLVEGHSRFDVKQGELGDCWFLAAIANITMRDELFYRVVPPDQSFTENYAGIFHFQFWQYGKWVDVVIDDRLPTYDGQLIYMHSRDHNEFWSALLEKAYAKLYGSYEALEGGMMSEALEDMTGGLAEILEIKDLEPKALLAMIVRGFEMGSMFGCSIDADPSSYEAKIDNGLVKGHAYSITGVRTVQTPRGQTTLLRIRNPWGQHEWNGPWSDGSREWDYVPSQIKQEMDVVIAQDGEFWMSYEDFLANFEQIEICHLGPDVMEEIFQMTDVRAPHKPWDTVVFEGAWVRGSTAGGCRNYPESYINNPQYPVALNADGQNTMIVALMQKYRRELMSEGFDNLAIGFGIYQAQRGQEKLDPSVLENDEPINKSSTFINLREVTGRFEMNSGNFVIVPSAFSPKEEAEFMLRIFSNGSISSPMENQVTQQFSNMNMASKHPPTYGQSYQQPSYGQAQTYGTYPRQPSAPPMEHQGQYQSYNQQLPYGYQPYRPSNQAPSSYHPSFGSGYGQPHGQPYPTPSYPTQQYPAQTSSYQPNVPQTQGYRPYVPNTGGPHQGQVYNMSYGQNFNRPYYDPNNQGYGWGPR